jgi:DNA invertase Pin-like site-specific DNA recombinase
MESAVSYLRCSGESQILGDTWDRQNESIAKFASVRGFEIVSEFRDEGVTGKMELEGRTGLSACIAYVQEYGIKTVLCESSDRLARDMIVAEVIVREFQKIGVRVFAASSGIDLTEGDDSNPTAKLIRQILAAVAEFDRCVVVLKLKAARTRIKEQGRAPGAKNYSPDPIRNRNAEGRHPFGWKPGEEPILKQMHMLKGLGMTPKTIAAKLNESGILSRYGLPWRGSTISKILARERKKAA